MTLKRPIRGDQFDDRLQNLATIHIDRMDELVDYVEIFRGSHHIAAAIEDLEDWCPPVRREPGLRAGTLLRLIATLEASDPTSDRLAEYRAELETLTRDANHG